MFAPVLFCICACVFAYDIERERERERERDIYYVCLCVCVLDNLACQQSTVSKAHLDTNIAHVCCCVDLTQGKHVQHFKYFSTSNCD